MPPAPPFAVIPAIDLKGGRCVRLWQGDMARETVYSERPEEVAAAWESAGAELIHVVDLDGAVSGRVANRAGVEAIVRTVSIPVELGGGIRDRETMDAYLSVGVRRLVLGTRAARDPEGLGRLLEGFPAEVYVGIDARDGLVAVEGWREVLPMEASALAAAVREAGAAGIIYTDISRDGTLEGPNFEAVERLLGQTDLPVIASGGVSRLQDVTRLAAMSRSNAGLRGVIVGRALYAGKLDLAEAIAAAAAARGEG